ncbi:pyridoxamine 5'-phosphate oxidase family protein [Acuticoccus mangrovi]|uniref:Pyridoxamine 5'-phosphate oxidase family protein n=1 Tax=Acuticoccus mangrovi TaxID=2796142 RepID=A0A934MBF2_9HYPH|nr:pyridoxamine 5'-phosphate oxidase family protein [Acuticoccus mangrovi]MBJ3774057.1 pyridoxamine 5'-phosphate oxidase family protein [Acuticoccus mangrovi]
MSTEAYTPTPRTKLRLRPDRGHYDRELVHAIIDEALIAHVGAVVNGEPRVLPTAIVRIGEDVYIHGSQANGVLGALKDGAPATITVTLIDSIVAGRSGFGFSLDYRSVMIFSHGEAVTDPEEKRGLVQAFVNDLMPGHTVRPPKPKELAATLFLRFPIEEVSAKVRDVGVLDVEEDYGLDLWAGKIPVSLAFGAPEDCPRLAEGIATPDYAQNYARPPMKRST